MAIYGSNMNILNAVKAMVASNPLMSDKCIWRGGGNMIAHNPRNNKRTKPSNAKRRRR